MSHTRYNGCLGATAGYVRKLLETALRFSAKKTMLPIDSDLQNGKINDKQELIDFDDVDKVRDFAQQQGILPTRQDTQQNLYGPAEQVVICAIIYLFFTASN